MNTISLGKIPKASSTTLMTKSAIYKANKNLFKHKIVSANDDDTYIEVEILSDDYLGSTSFFYRL